MEFFYLLTIIVVAIVLYRKIWNSKKWKMPKSPFPDEWRKILTEKIGFYNTLTNDEKKHFEFKVQEFLLNCKVTGIQTTVDETDKILVAASAIIPIFAFRHWRYTNIYEVLVYPTSFNEKFETKGEDNRILGMVGTGYMEGKMILSKKALHRGFANETDKKNTAIHEFVHLIDKMDGTTDGIPQVLLDNNYAIPWIDLISKKIDDIYANKSDINPYGGTNKAEFFAVAGEYFFERPKVLKQKHPQLYVMMEEIFDQKMSKRNLLSKRKTVGRNSPCPCSSGKKYKHCCGKGK